MQSEAKTQKDVKKILNIQHLIDSLILSSLCSNYYNSSLIWISLILSQSTVMVQNSRM